MAYSRNEFEAWADEQEDASEANAEVPVDQYATC